MIQKVGKKMDLRSHNEIRQNREYWLGRQKELADAEVLEGGQ